MDDICFAPAKKLAGLVRARKLSATEVMRAFIAQVERSNPKVNAIVTFLPEQALKEAKALDRKRGPKPPLAGPERPFDRLFRTGETVVLSGEHVSRQYADPG